MRTVFRYALGSQLLIAVALAFDAPARAADQGQTVLVSGPTNVFAPLLTPVGPAYNPNDSVTENGRWVAFISRSDSLSDVDDDRSRTPSARHAAGTLTLLNSTANGAPDTAPPGWSRSRTTRRPRRASRSSPPRS